MSFIRKPSVLFYGWIFRALFVTCTFNWVCLRALFVTCRFYWVCLQIFRALDVTCRFCWMCSFLWVDISGTFRDLQILLSVFTDFVDILGSYRTCRFWWVCSVLWMDNCLGLFIWLANFTECVYGYLGFLHEYLWLLMWHAGLVESVLFCWGCSVLWMDI